MMNSTKTEARRVGDKIAVTVSRAAYTISNQDGRVDFLVLMNDEEALLHVTSVMTALEERREVRAG